MGGEGLAAAVGGEMGAAAMALLIGVPELGLRKASSILSVRARGVTRGGIPGRTRTDTGAQSTACGQAVAAVPAR